MRGFRSLVRNSAAVALGAALLWLVPGAFAQDQKPSVEEQGKKLQPRVEELRGLKFDHPVTVAVQDRDTLRKKLLADFEKELPRDKAVRYQKALQKYGFVKPGVDLWQTIVDLLSEQIAGFYDPETKELYLIAGSADGKGEGKPDPNKAMMEMMGIDQDRLTIVHELTHALQDQHFNLLTLPMDAEDDDDLVAASKALVEGEATFTMFDDITEKMGMGLENMPGLDQMMDMGGALPDGPGAEQLEKAPNFLKRGLIFPYMSGLAFVQAVKKARGWKGVDQIYQDLPASTEQILHPAKYLDERDQPTIVTMPDLGKVLGADWELLHTNVWGELSFEIMFKEFFPTSKTSTVTGGWDGDQYRVFENRKDHALLGVMFTVWDSEKDAEQFATAYKKLIAKKYGLEAPTEKRDRYEWTHEERGILLERRGAEVIAIEGAPKESLKALEESLWGQTGRKELAHVERVARADGAGVTPAKREDKPKESSKAGTPRSSGKKNPKTATLKGEGFTVATTLEFDCCRYVEIHGVGESSCVDCSSVFRVAGFPAGEGETLSDALTVARSRLGAMVDGLKVVSQQPIKVDGRVGVRLMLSGTPSDVGQEVALDLIVVQGNAHFFVFVDVAAAADYDICKDAFSQWVKSAKIAE